MIQLLAWPVCAERQKPRTEDECQLDHDGEKTLWKRCWSTGCVFMVHTDRSVLLSCHVDVGPLMRSRSLRRNGQSRAVLGSLWPKLSCLLILCQNDPSSLTMSVWRVVFFHLVFLSLSASSPCRMCGCRCCSSQDNFNFVFHAGRKESQLPQQQWMFCVCSGYNECERAPWVSK